MKRTIMSYMVATILSLTAVIGMAMQPTAQMAQAQAQAQAQTQTQTPSTSSSQNPSTSSSSASSTTITPVTNPACGEVVQGVVNLTSNLNCTGTDGLLVGGDGTTINLNGYTLSGPGPQSSKVGIVVPANEHVTVNGPGLLKNWQAGLLVTGANDVQAKLVGFTGNEIGVFATGARQVSLSQDQLYGNNLGMAFHSSQGTSILSNMITGNQLAGITLVNARDSVIAANNVEGGQNGIFMDAQSHSNTINMNNVLHNVIDLNNANGLAPNINVNSYADNNCMVSNPSGLCIGR